MGYPAEGKIMFVLDDSGKHPELAEGGCLQRTSCGALIRSIRIHSGQANAITFDQRAM